MPREESNDFTLLPEDTVIFAPFEGHVTILFPTDEDAIVFHEFLQAFIAGEIELEARDKRERDDEN